MILEAMGKDEDFDWVADRPATTAATPSTPSSSSASSAGGRPAPTSPRGSRPPSTGTSPKVPGGARQGATEPATARRASKEGRRHADIAFREGPLRRRDRHQGASRSSTSPSTATRGWFKENWQRAKMTALGIPDPRRPEQRLLQRQPRRHPRHPPEPWDKFISVARSSSSAPGRPARQRDLRQGLPRTLDPSKAIYVPRGVGNSFQALEDGTAYTHLVDAHWSLELRGPTFVNLADPELAISGRSRSTRPPSPRRTKITRC